MIGMEATSRLFSSMAKGHGQENNSSPVRYWSSAGFKIHSDYMTGKNENNILVV